MLEPGKPFGGGYRLEKPLGNGAMGEVWLATNLALNEPRAIKIVHSKLDPDPFFRELFLKEARVALRLGHYPHFVRVYEAGLHTGNPFLVMEYVRGLPEGNDLARLLASRSRFLPGEVATMLDQIALALEAAHRQGLAHLDLKPSNILVDRDEAGQLYLKVGDFGLTRDMKITQPGSVYGVTGGTPPYMAPEQWLDKPEIASDQYSLGIIVYQLLSGALPFKTSNRDELREMHLKQAVPSLLPQIPGLPPTLDEVVLKTLAKQPGQRFATVSDFAAAFREALAPGQATVALKPGQPSITPNPYLGLAAFREVDAPFFFGREEFTRQLLQIVPDRPLVALVGPSGSGKSSVVFAGLIPKLREAKSWVVATFRPGDQPFQALARALVPFLELRMSETERIVEANKLGAGLSQGMLHLPQVISRIREKNEVSSVLLVIDQFEEIYTLTTNQNERRRFLEELLALVPAAGQTALAGNLLLTLRADFLGYTLDFRPLADALQNNDLKLGPMNEKELKAAVEEPARLQGVTLEEGLADRIVEVVSQNPGDLPLLEFALAQLWSRQRNRRLTHAAYDEIGGVEGALVGHAEDVFSRFNPADQKKVEMLFRKLVRVSQGGEDTRRVATRAEIGDESWSLVNRLVAARLLVTGRNELSGQEEVELIHESLLNRWTRLKGWINADRQFLLWLERLRNLFAQWVASNWDEGALLRGLTLTEAEHYLANRGAEMGMKEHEFIQASLKLREREQAGRKRLRRTIIGGLGVALLVTLMLAILAFLQWQDADNNRVLAENAQYTAVANMVDAQKQRDFADNQRRISQSRQLAVQSYDLFNSNPDLSLLLGVEANRIAPTNEANSTLVNETGQLPLLSQTLRGHDGPIYSLAFDPLGNVLASGSADKTIKIWDVATGKLITTLAGHEGAVKTLAFSPDAKLLASGSADNTIRLWETGKYTLVGTLEGHTGPVNTLAFIGTTGKLVSGSSDGTLRVWDLATRRLIRTSYSYNGPVTSIQYVAASNQNITKYLYSAGSDNYIHELNADTFQDLNETPRYTKVHAMVSSMLVSWVPSGENYIYTAMTNGEIQRWSTKNQTMSTVFSGIKIKSLAFIYYAVIGGGEDGVLRIWDNYSFHQAVTLNGHSAPINVVATNESRNIFASGSEDNVIRIWSYTSKNQLAYVDGGHTDSINAIAYRPDGKLFATAGSESWSIKLWNAVPSYALDQLRNDDLYGSKGPIRALAFSPDSTRLASASEDKTVGMWDMATGKLITRLTGSTGPLYTVAYSPDGLRVAAGGEDKKVYIWEGNTTKLLGTLSGHTDAINSVAFSPDGKWLASAGNDKTICLWEAGSGRLVATFTGHNREINSIAFSPDSTRLASGSADKTIRVWEIPSGKVLYSLSGSTGAILSVAFSPDGQFIGSGSADTGVRLYAASTGKQVALLARHMWWVSGVAFSPDSSRIASSSFDTTAILWKIPAFEDNVARACQIVKRNLTESEWQLYLGNEAYQKTCPDFP